MIYYLWHGKSFVAYYKHLTDALAMQHWLSLKGHKITIEKVEL